MHARIHYETRAATLVLHKVKYSFRKMSDTLESTQAPAIFLFRGLSSRTTLPALNLMAHSIQVIFRRAFLEDEGRLQVLL